jgi:hypothetical protein
MTQTIGVLAQPREGQPSERLVTSQPSNRQAPQRLASLHLNPPDLQQTYESTFSLSVHLQYWRCSIMSEHESPFLSLPPEIRTIIFHHLFENRRLAHLRSPSHRRLRAARTDKEDTSGVLQTCRLLRQEAIPPFYSRSTLVFRHSTDVLEFLKDSGLSGSIRENVAHIAVDDGDVKDVKSVRESQKVTILQTFAHLPRLKMLEFRVYARTDNADWLRNLNSLHNFWVLLTVEITSKRMGFFIVDEDSSSKDVISELALRLMDIPDLKVSLARSQAKYQAARMNIPDQTDLVVRNLVLCRGAQGKALMAPALGGAEAAVASRILVTGAMHIADDNILERKNWTEEDLAFCVSGWAARHEFQGIR